MSSALKQKIAPELTVILRNPEVLNAYRAVCDQAQGEINSRYRELIGGDNSPATVIRVLQGLDHKHRDDAAAVSTPRNYGQRHGSSFSVIKHMKDR